MKGYSSRIMSFSAVLIVSAMLLTSCESMNEMFDNKTQQINYTDAYSPNTVSINSEQAVDAPRSHPAQKVSEKEITQTAAPKVTTVHRTMNSSQVPLNAPTVE